MKLSTGAEMRITNRVDEYAVVCVNGGQAREVEGTWSASIEWLVQTLAPRLPELGFAEVRYRVKSWRRLESCVDDARAAVAEVGAPRVVLLGFSMGGAVSVAIANEPVVEEVVGLAPWIPDQLDVSTLRRKRLTESRNEVGVPLLSKVPYVNRLFRNVSIGRETNSLMMMVTPRIIIQEEEEERLGIAAP